MIDLSKQIANLSPQQRELVHQQLKNKRNGVSRISITPQKRDTNTFPLSFAQQRLWFLDQLEPGRSVYNIPAALRLGGRLDVAALEQSLTEIIRRHEILRTTFPTVEGQAVQFIAPPQPLSVAQHDLRQFLETEQEVQVQRLTGEEARRPFDLARGPLLRAVLLQLNAEDHVLLLTLHHIIFDGWSMGLFFEELSSLYSAFSRGKSSPLPELPIQYADFALWQREWLQGEVLEKQLVYWQKQLAGASPVLEIVTDRPRPAIQTYRGASHTLILSKPLSEALKALSQRAGCTLFMTLLAAFKTLLYRYTGQEDITVGSPIANRNRSELDRLMGFFVNTLVLRTELKGNPTFWELLERVREVALSAYDHQGLPFEKLMQVLQPQRDLSRNPLFQVMFILQNAPLKPVELSNLTLTSWEVDTGTAKFDLSLSLVDTAQGLSGRLEYSTDLFDSTTISRFVSHFQTLVEGIVANHGHHISDLPLLTEAERQQLLVEWNDTKKSYPQDQCIHHLFEIQVEQTPEAVAIILPSTDLGDHKDKRLTYQELNRRANQLAHHLRSLGVGPEVFVGICMERSPGMVIGLLGILKAGGAYVPLDPAYPPERLAFILADTQAPVLLTQQHLLGILPEYEAHLVCLDADWEIIAWESEVNPILEMSGDNLAYIIYTSGSTGRPKGVLGLHGGAVNRFNWMWETYPFEAGEVCCQKTTLNFVDSIWEIFGPLLKGIPTVIIPDEAVKDPHQFVQILALHRVTRIVLVPSFLRIILDICDHLKSRLPDLRIWVTSGEALTLELAQRFQKSMPQCRLINLYGSSEVSADSTWYDTSESEALSCIPIGRPIANTQIYILDPHLQPVPMGVPGELHIGGAGLARGYLNCPELTTQKFIPNGFSGDLSARLYKTGDLARYLPDGHIEFLGRIDHQVKMRGFRIELEEIEATLERHPSVRESIVTARNVDHIPGEKQLVAYLVFQQEQIAIDEIRNFLKLRLPEYMVPSAFVLLEALPLTPNGKVDRRALPAPDRIRSKLKNSFIPPRDLLELQLMKIWEEVLGTHPIGLNDNFFELGGHSLLVVRLSAQIEKAFSQSLSLATFFQAPTVEQLANVLRKSQVDKPVTWASLVPIQPYGSKPPFFCVPGNLGNVFVDLGDLARHLGPDQPFYGLQDGVQNPSQIKALASHYISEIRTVQPEGPYRLGGVCWGGIVAFEMAQQLQAQGQHVALLVLVEPMSPPLDRLRLYLDILISLASRMLQRFGHHSHSLLQHDPVENRAYLHLKTKLFSNMWAAARYVPQCYPGRITLFLADEALAKSPNDPRLTWRNLAARGLEIYPVPGSHETITRTHNAFPEEAHTQVLAERLRTCLDATLPNSL